jgi:hypothetical protein
MERNSDATGDEHTYNQRKTLPSMPRREVKSPGYGLAYCFEVVYRRRYSNAIDTRLFIPFCHIHWTKESVNNQRITSFFS